MYEAKVRKTEIGGRNNVMENIRSRASNNKGRPKHEREKECIEKQRTNKTGRRKDA